MQMSPVSSTLISAIGYDAEKRALLVVFLKGGSYRYQNFPPALWEQFKAASSKGKFFLQNIKPQYTGVKQ